MQTDVIGPGSLVIYPRSYRRAVLARERVWSAKVNRHPTPVGRRWGERNQPLAWRELGIAHAVDLRLRCRESLVLSAWFTVTQSSHLRGNAAAAELGQQAPMAPMQPLAGKAPSDRQGRVYPSGWGWETGLRRNLR